jgi:hypothetical protein
MVIIIREYGDLLELADFAGGHGPGGDGLIVGIGAAIAADVAGGHLVSRLRWDRRIYHDINVLDP